MTAVILLRLEWKCAFGKKHQLNSRERQEMKYFFIIILDSQKDVF